MLNILNGVEEDQGPLELHFFSSVNFLLQMQLVYYSIPQSPARSPGRRETLPYWVSLLLLCCKGNKKHLVLVPARSHMTWRHSFLQSLVHRECWGSLATLNEDIGIPWMLLADLALEKPLRNDFTGWLLQRFSSTAMTLSFFLAKIKCRVRMKWPRQISYSAPCGVNSGCSSCP